MAGTKPTERQIGFLEARGIIAPPTKHSASRLIDFVKNGLRGHGKTEGERIAIIRASQKKFLGKRVRYLGDHKSGTVLYFQVYTIAEYADRWKQYSKDLNPFRAAVRFDGGGTQVVSMAFLELIDEDAHLS